MNRREEEIAQQVGPSRARRGEEPPYIAGKVASPAISGYFTKVNVPAEIPVGGDVNVEIGFYAVNPGALYWATFLVADSPGMDVRRLLDKAREVGEEGHRTKTYNLGPMPNNVIAISIFLFAHNDAGYNWDWGEYYSWLEGYPVAITHLASEYRFVSPITAPPPPPPDGAELSGVITRVRPLEFAFGQPIDLVIDFNAYVETVWEQIHGWNTRLTATLNGRSDSDIQTHIGRDGSRTGETLNLGAMPNKDLSGTLVLEGRGKNLLGLPTKWEELDRQSLAVSVSELPPVYTCPYCGAEFPTKAELDAHIKLAHPEVPPPEKEFPWLQVALIGSAAIVAAAVLIKPARKKS